MFLTIEQAAHLLNVKESWLRSRVFHKDIPYLKFGRHVRFDAAALQEWISCSKSGYQGEKS